MDPIKETVYKNYIEIQQAWEKCLSWFLNGPASRLFPDVLQWHKDVEDTW